MLSASEINQYAYCPKSWWKQRTGEKIETKEMKEGTQYHDQKASKQLQARQLYITRNILILLIILAAITTSIIFIGGLI